MAPLSQSPPQTWETPFLSRVGRVDSSSTRPPLALAAITTFAVMSSQKKPPGRFEKMPSGIKGVFGDGGRKLRQDMRLG